MRGGHRGEGSTFKQHISLQVLRLVGKKFTIRSECICSHAPPPPYTYLTHVTTCDKCSQAFPVFLLFRYRVLHELKNKNGGGLETRLCMYHIHLVRLLLDTFPQVN